MLASGVPVVTTDAIRYIMDGTRHLGSGEQPTTAELAKMGDYLKRAPAPRIEITPADGAMSASDRARRPSMRRSRGSS